MPEVGKIQIKWHGEDVIKDFNAKMEKVVKSAGEAVKAEAIRSIRDDPKTGRWYTGRSGRYYQASAASESPAIDTGSLMRSISVLMEKDKDSVTAYIGTMDASKHDPQYKKEVSWLLERGTHKRKPRPFMLPALEKIRQKMNEILEGVAKT